MNDDTNTTCRCGRPTREGRSFCEDCADRLAYALGEIPWLVEQLDISVTRMKGVDYRTKGGTQAAERPSIVAWTVSDARTHLRGMLVAWCRYSHEEHIRHQSPTDGLPADDLISMSRWLMWRVDGLALADIGPAAVDEITDAVQKCHRLIDTPAEKMYAGKCGHELTSTDTTCANELYVRVGARKVKCSDCGAEWDVAERRSWLLEEAEEVLATAVEISRAVSWLGEEPLTAERVRKWASRERLTVRGHDRDNRPLYRVGDAIDLLSGNAAKGSAA